MGAPTQSLAIAIDEARECDAAFVFSSWTHSYRDSPGTSRWPAEKYAAWICDHIESTLARSRVLVARPVDWDEGIIGWAAGEQRSGKFILHYAFVRPLFRQSGALGMLLAAHAPQGRRLLATLRPPYTDYIKRLGYRYEPRRVK